MLISIHLVSFYFTLQLKKINNNVVQKQVNGSLLPASVISLYCAYVCYTGLASEPQGYECNGLNKSRAVSTSTLVLGMLTTVLSVLYSALRAGSSTTFLSPPSSPRAGNRTSQDSFNISFFHSCVGILDSILLRLFIMYHTIAFIVLLNIHVCSYFISI
jgi:hypothetical protein